MGLMQYSLRKSIIAAIFFILGFIGAAIGFGYAYVTGAKDARMYENSPRCVAGQTSECRQVTSAVVQDLYSESHRRANKYFVELKTKDGKIHPTQIVSYASWEQLKLDDSVTVEVWRDIVTHIQINGNEEATADNPVSSNRVIMLSGLIIVPIIGLFALTFIILTVIKLLRR